MVEVEPVELMVILLHLEVLVEEVHLDLTFQEEMDKQILEAAEAAGVSNLEHQVQDNIQADLVDLEKSYLKNLVNLQLIKVGCGICKHIIYTFLPVNWDK